MSQMSTSTLTKQCGKCIACSVGFMIFLSGLGTLILLIVLLDKGDNEISVGGDYECISPINLTNAFLFGSVYAACLAVCGVLLVLLTLPCTDFFRRNFKRLDMRPGSVSTLSEDLSLNRKKTNGGASLNVLLFLVYILLFAVAIGGYLQRTDNYQMTTSYTLPQLALQFTQLHFNASADTCDYLANVSVPSVITDCNTNCAPYITNLGCKYGTDKYYHISWAIILPPTYTYGNSPPTCQTTITQNATTLSSWKISALIQDAPSASTSMYACGVSEGFSSSSESTWDSVVFPDSSFCGYSNGNVTVTAIPRAECQTGSMFDTSISPIRASYSLRNVGQPTGYFSGVFNLVVTQDLSKDAICIFDKSSQYSLLMQAVSLFGGVLGVQQVLRMLIGKYEDYEERRKKKAGEEQPLLSVNKTQ